MTSTLYVKNMVCDRCIRVVRDELTAMKLDVRSVALGEVVVERTAKELPIDKIKSVLEQNGFELIEDRKAKIIERLKLAILKLVRQDYEGRDQRIKSSEDPEQGTRSRLSPPQHAFLIRGKHHH